MYLKYLKKTKQEKKIRTRNIGLENVTLAEFLRLCLSASKETRKYKIWNKTKHNFLGLEKYEIYSFIF